MLSMNNPLYSLLLTQQSPAIAPPMTHPTTAHRLAPPAAPHAQRLTLTLQWRNKTVCLSPRETQLFRLLLREQGRWLTASQIAEALWGDGDAPGQNRANQLVWSLRHKLYQFVRTHPTRGHGWGVPVDAMIPRELA